MVKAGDWPDESSGCLPDDIMQSRKSDQAYSDVQPGSMVNPQLLPESTVASHPNPIQLPTLPVARGLKLVSSANWWSTAHMEQEVLRAVGKLVVHNR